MIADVGRFALFCGHYARVAFTNPPSWRRVMASTYAIGVRSLPILLVIAAFIGTNLSIQGYSAFEPLGARGMVGMFVALAGVRELAPIIAASMVAAKAGTEMASQIAVMRIRQQIDALEVMAVQPHAFLITPRLVGIVLAMPALTAIATCAMVGASYVVATAQLGLNGTTFLEHATGSVAPIDLVWGLVKAMIFGVVICLISCFNGFRSEPGPEGVGRATNRAVVLSAVTCVLVNYVLSEVFYG